MHLLFRNVYVYAYQIFEINQTSCLSRVIKKNYLFNQNYKEFYAVPLTNAAVNL